MTTPEKYDFCKPEDWDEMAESCPEADEFLKGRSMYREYLELRLVLYASTGQQRELVERKLAELEAEIVSWPYRKPRPPTKPQTEMPNLFPNDPEMGFLAGLTMGEREIILDAARRQLYDDMSRGGDRATRLNANLVTNLIEAFFDKRKSSENDSPDGFYLDGIPSVTYPDINAAIEGANDFMDMHMNANTVIVFDLFTKAPVALAYRVDDGYCVALIKEQE